MGWIREGSCPPERCQGRCCKHIGVWFDDTPGSMDFLRVLSARGVGVYETDTDAGRRFMTRIEQRCQWLTDDNLCALHPSMNPGPELPKRPEWCDVWPTEPQQLILDHYCGFTFRQEDESLSEVGTSE